MGTGHEFFERVAELDHRSSGRRDVSLFWDGSTKGLFVQFDDTVLRAELRSLCRRRGEESSERSVDRAASVRCRLGLHRMRYSGVTLGQRIERCERCRVRRPTL